VIPTLSAKQRQGMEELGLPLPVYDPETRRGFLVVKAEISPDSLGGYVASTGDCPVVAGGDSVEDALIALSSILRSPMGSSQ